MTNVVSLVEKTVTPNDILVEEIELLLKEAKSGEFTGGIIVKLRDDAKFAVRKIGIISDLAMVGALTFAQHDIMNANSPISEEE